MSRTILLADDSVTIQKVIELTFMDEDYEVVAVGNGDDALEKLEEITPDFVIADVHMPGANGYDVAKHSKSLRPDVPVLLLVGTFEPFDEEQAQKSGCDAYLKKPFDSQELQRLVEELSADSEHGKDLSGPLEATGWRAESPEGPGGAPGSEAAAAPGGAAAGAGAVGIGGAPEESKAEPFSIGLDDDEETPSTRVEPPVFDLEELQALPGMPGDEAPDVVPEVEISTVGSAGGDEEPAFGDLPAELPPVSAPPEAVPAAPVEPPAVAGEAAQVAGVVSEALGSPLSDEDVDRVARRIVELLGDRAIRDVAWEVVPDMAEVVIRSRLRELENQVESVE